MNAKLTAAKGDKTGTIQIDGQSYDHGIAMALLGPLACADIIDGQSYDLSEVEAIVRGDKKYSVQTDGFSCDDFFAGSLDEAIEYAFDGEGLGKIVDEDSLRAKFQKYVDDGGYCVIECEGEEVLVLGKPF